MLAECFAPVHFSCGSSSALAARSGQGWQRVLLAASARRVGGHDAEVLEQDYQAVHTVPIEMLRRLVQAQPHLGGALQQDVADAFQYFGLDVRLLHVELAAASESVCANGVVQAALDDVLLASEVAPLDFILEVALPAPHVAAPPPPCVAVHCPTAFPAGDGFRYTRCRISGADSPLTIGSGLNAAEYRLRAYVEHRHNGQPGRNSRAGGHYVAYFKNSSSWYLANDFIATHRPVTDSTGV